MNEGSSSSSGSVQSASAADTAAVSASLSVRLLKDSLAKTFEKCVFGIKFKTFAGHFKPICDRNEADLRAIYRRFQKNLAKSIQMEMDAILAEEKTFVERLHARDCLLEKAKRKSESPTGSDDDDNDAEGRTSPSSLKKCYRDQLKEYLDTCHQRMEEMRQKVASNDEELSAMMEDVQGKEKHLYESARHLQHASRCMEMSVAEMLNNADKVCECSADDDDDDQGFSLK